MARDVIVIGAGGGGPVVAKELAERGLDVLVLEAGARYKRSSREWSHLEWDANDPVHGYRRWGPSDSTKPPRNRDRPKCSFLWEYSGKRLTTHRCEGKLRRARPGVV